MKSCVYDENMLTVCLHVIPTYGQPEWIMKHYRTVFIFHLIDSNLCLKIIFLVLEKLYLLSAKTPVDLAPTHRQLELVKELILIFCLNYLNLCLKIIILRSKIVFSVFEKLCLYSAKTSVYLLPTHGQPG